MHSHRCTVNCIIPDHMLEHLAKSERVSPKMRTWAMRSLVRTARLRGHRDVLSLTSAPTPGGRKDRRVYSAQDDWILPGTLVRGEGAPAVADEAVNKVYDGFGATYDLFHDEYGRDSLDNRGHSLIGTVHYGDDYGNAFWNGSQMVFGDGDGEIFVSFTEAIDVIGHELTHGVVDFTSQLVYARQPGALNESFADVFGSLVKQRVLEQTADQADWLIGQGLFGQTVAGVALRSMKAPGTAYDDPRIGKDPQPAHMENYNPTPTDNYGVHINSGIPNHAFYLFATQLGGYAWEDAGRVWYKALLKLSPYSEFQEAANATYQAAGEVLGECSVGQQAIRDAWSAVGIRVQGARFERRVRKSAAAVAERLDGSYEKILEEIKRLLSGTLSGVENGGEPVGAAR